MMRTFYIFLGLLFPLQGFANNQAPVCGSRFLNDFIKHYGLIECLSRGDKLCVSHRINEKSTTAFASMAGVTGAAASKVATSRFLGGFVKEGAKSVTSKVAWGAIAGGTYFVVTKTVGGVIGFLADTSEAGDCRDMHPWVLRVKVRGYCEIAYKITDNRVAEDFFNLANESEQLAILKDPQACEYFYNLHNLLKAKGEAMAAQQDINTPGLFVDSQEPVSTPKGDRLRKTNEKKAGGAR